jgi:hypothetical protein
VTRTAAGAICLVVAAALSGDVIGRVEASGGHGAALPQAFEYVGTTDAKFPQPANNVWNVCGSLSLQPGAYRLSGRAAVYSARPKSDLGTVSAIMALTTAQGIAAPWSGTTWPGDRRLVSFARVGAQSYRMLFTEQVERAIAIDVPTTFYLAVTESEGNNWDSLQCLGASVSPTVIRAEVLP